jgi:hypothetical protein
MIMARYYPMDGTFITPPLPEPVCVVNLSVGPQLHRRWSRHAELERLAERVA